MNWIAPFDTPTSASRLPRYSPRIPSSRASRVRPSITPRYGTARSGSTCRDEVNMRVFTTQSGLVMKAVMTPLEAEASRCWPALRRTDGSSPAMRALISVYLIVSALVERHDGPQEVEAPARGVADEVRTEPAIQRPRPVRPAGDPPQAPDDPTDALGRDLVLDLEHVERVHAHGRDEARADAREHLRPGRQRPWGLRRRRRCTRLGHWTSLSSVRARSSLTRASPSGGSRRSRARLWVQTRVRSDLTACAGVASER